MNYEIISCYAWRHSDFVAFRVVRRYLDISTVCFHFLIET